MKRFLHFSVALAILLVALWCFYAGYERQISLAGRTETGLIYMKTGFDGRTRVLTHHWLYGIGAVLLVGSSWWLLHGHKPAKTSRRRR